MSFELRAVGLREFSVEIGIDEARDPCAAERLPAAHDFSPPLLARKLDHIARFHDALSYGVIAQRLLQQAPAAMQPAHHRADRAIHDVGDLLVREVFEVAQDHRHAVVVRHRLERALDVVGDQVADELPLGIARGDGHVLAHQRRHLFLVDHVAHFALADLLAILVDERVRQDLEEPRLAVGARLEAMEEAIGREHRVLHEIFGVARIARHAQTGGVQAVEMPHGLRLEAVAPTVRHRLRGSSQHVVNGNAGTPALFPRKN